MKKSLEISENFYQANLFTFNTCSCFCAIDTINYSKTETRKIFKVAPIPGQAIKFAFQPKKGLVRINANNGAIEEENILSSLVSIKATDIDGYKKFFEKNGFFFPLKKDDFVELDDNSLFVIIGIIKDTLELMSQISEVSRKDYKKIMELSMRLLLSNQYALKIGEYEYTTCNHSHLHELLKISADKSDNHTNFPDKDYNLNIKDSIYGNHKIHADVYHHIMGDPDMFDDFWLAVYYAYVNYQDAPADDRLLIEVLYHLKFEVKCLGQYYTINWNKFDDPLKQAILKVAKMVVSEEINSNLEGVYPEYDCITMEPRWKVNSLMSALYFSFFYMRPNVEVTRICANPRCGRFFTVSRTSMKKKYCTTECGNRANQNNHRAKKRIENQ